MARKKPDISSGNKLAAIDDSDAESLPELTPRQLGFVKGLAEGKTAAQSYRAAYDTAAMQENTIWAEASRLKRNRKIAAWISELRKHELSAAIITRESSLATLESLRERAADAGQYTAAVAAEANRGRLAGLYVERAEISVQSADNLLRQIVALNPEIGRQVAKLYSLEHTIDITPENARTADTNDASSP